MKSEKRAREDVVRQLCSGESADVGLAEKTLLVRKGAFSIGAGLVLTRYHAAYTGCDVINRRL